MQLKPDLKGIATEIEDIITEKPEAVRVFRENIVTYAKACEQYWESRCNEPQAYLDPTGKKQREGYEYDKELEAWFPVNTQELLPDPTKWKMENKYPCYYATLALIYDIYKAKTAPYSIWPDCIEGLEKYHLVVGLMQRYLEGGIQPFTQGNLDSALKWVKSDLKERAETEPNATAGKVHRRKSSYLKEVPRWIYILIIFLAALLAVFSYMGWLEPIKAFIKNIL